MNLNHCEAEFLKQTVKEQRIDFEILSEHYRASDDPRHTERKLVK